MVPHVQTAAYPSTVECTSEFWWTVECTNCLLRINPGSVAFISTPPPQCPMSHSSVQTAAPHTWLRGSLYPDPPQVVTGLMQVIYVSPSLFIPCPHTQTQALPSVPTGPQHGAEQGASPRQPREAV